MKNIPSKKGIKKYTYMQLEYLQSDGASWINTLYKFTSEDNQQVKVKYSSLMLGGYYHQFRLAGSYNGSGRSFILYNNINPIYLGLGGADLDTGIRTTTEDTHEVDYSITTQGVCDIIYDGQVGQIGYSGSVATNNDYIIFACNENGGISGPSFNRVYSFQMFENGEMVRDFVAARRASDGELGLYDRVEGKFYTNQGTGSFGGGKDVGYIYEKEKD